MQIDRVVLGSYETNSYILRVGEGVQDCLIIDTGLGSEGLIDILKEYQLTPVAVVFTHGHADHIAGLPLLRQSFGEIKAYIHKLDSGMLTEPMSNLSALGGGNFSTEPADHLLGQDDIIDEAGIKLRVLHTPGHTPGGISLYAADEGIVFVGDTLFADSVGRTDFPGGSAPELIKSIREKLLCLGDETVVYPGHGPETTIQQEKAYNPFLQ
jgi:hydroxyacylglutathione hydrolase